MRRKRSEGAWRRAAFVGALLMSLCVVPGALAGTAGKLSGRVLDKKKQPLTGANVAIPAARLGAVSDAEGRYSIIGIPAGTYEVKVNLLGYGPVAVQDVRVSADNTTALDVELGEAPLLMKEIVISAQRPVVDLKLTSTMSTLSREDLKAMPVQELQDVVNLQAGVVDGHFRGGRLGEVQYQVDGVSVNNSYDNTSSLRIDRSLIEEVQVISGTFDAEYGKAMSGVVNAVLRRGTDRFRWDAEVLAGGYAYSAVKRNVAPEFYVARPGTQSYQASLSGPTGLPETYFLVNGRRGVSDDYLSAMRRFRPTDTLIVDPETQQTYYRATGDREQVPLGYSREWSGVAKLTNRSLPNIELNYQGILNLLDAQKVNYAYRLDPDGMSKQRTYSLVHGLDWTHTLSKTRFYNISLRQNYFDYRDMVYDARTFFHNISLPFDYRDLMRVLVYDDAYDPRYDAAGPAVPDENLLGANIEGVDFTRFRQRTNSIVWKNSLVSQVTRDVQIKIGAEFEWPKVSFGHPGFLEFTQYKGKDSLFRHVNEPPKYPGVQQYRPYSASAFAQEDLEWNDLRVRAGLRFEYFNPMARLPSDLANPANAIEGQPAPPSRVTTRKVSLAPRLGVSYPVTRDAALFFAYGHFYQMPPLRDIFQNADYNILKDLQSSTIDYGVLGNPDIRPQQTVQYQFGYKQAVTEWLGVDLSLFYKDIRDLIGVEFISTYNDAEYARMTNVDFGNVLGFTVTLEQRRRGLISTALDYTWQTARGNSSDPQETATRAKAGQDPRPRQVPFDWDQRHTLNLTVMLSRPDDFSLSGIVRVASGQPYTPAITAGFLGSLAENSGRKPVGMLVDLRADKSLRVGGVGASLFARAFNLLDSRFFNGFVFDNSGSPDYSRYPEADRNKLADPTRFYGPRRIEVGLTLNSGAKGT